MEPCNVFDGHNDAVQYIREFKPNGRDFLQRSEEGHLDLVRAGEGRMIGGLFALSAYAEVEPVDDLTITEDGYEVRYAGALRPEYARQQIEGQLNAIERLVNRSGGKIAIPRSVAEIDHNRSKQIFSIVLHMEGAEAIGPDLNLLDDLYARGLRSLGPVWSRPNAFGFGVPFAYPRSPDTGPGLTPAGKDLIRKCDDLGIIIDVSHLNERGFWDVAAISKSPLVATHTCAHAICPSTRNLTDKQLDAIRDTNGIVGFNISVNDVRSDGHLDANIPLEAVASHINYIVEKVGPDCVALGSDFDGAVIPSAIGDASGLQKLLQALWGRGFDQSAIEKFAMGNWLRLFSLSWRQSV